MDPVDHDYADLKSANHNVANELSKFRKPPKEAIAAATRLLGRMEENTSSRAGRPPPNLLFLSKIQKVTQREDFPGDSRIPPSAEDELLAIQFEEDIWKMYGFTGDVVPDELLKACQKRLREAEPGSSCDMQAREELEALDLIHRYRKNRSFAFSRSAEEGIWMNAQVVPPCEQLRAIGPHFWALIIGNDEYPRSPLGGCVNDALLVRGYLTTYLNVPNDHIRLLRNATRDCMMHALYDLRDDERIKPGNNILIHFSGHGSSYDCRDYFKTFASRAGSIEAICPVDRDENIPDISERELNSVLSELKAAKGPNITVILDCCHSGGAVRSLETMRLLRFLPPLRGPGGAIGLEAVFRAADDNPRRHSNKSTASETWEADLSPFVMLAACQDFETAEETNFDSSVSESRAMMMIGLHKASSRHGKFTWALIKILQSKWGRTATYESVIALIGRLGPMQLPLAVGMRKSSQLWYNGESAGGLLQRK